MKRIAVFTIILALLASLLPLTGCRRRIRHLTYTEDYLAEYAAELGGILGDFSAGERTEVHIEGEDCSCGYHQDTVDRYEWPLTYTDACGRTMTCTLNNSSGIACQQLEWLEDQLESHFYEDYARRFFGDMLTDKGSYCYCSIGRICTGYTGGNKEEEAHVETCSAYRSALEKSGEPIALSSQSYAELLEELPVTVHLQLAVVCGEKSLDELNARFSSAEELLEEMAETMAAELGTGLNLTARVRLDGEDGQTYQNRSVRYIRGERTSLDGFAFDHAVFKTYEGKFW